MAGVVVGERNKKNRAKYPQSIAAPTPTCTSSVGLALGSMVGVADGAIDGALVGL